MLRGARQVGKTFIVRELGAKFTNFIEINFLDNKDLHSVFKRGNFNIDKIVDEISVYFSKPLIDGSSLLFLDEIQACPEAIESLRFFYEKRPNLHVIVAGSLLEFALSEIPSFGVGRTENLFLHPLNFREYLTAQKREELLKQIQSSTPKLPLPEALHRLALEEFKTFLLIGGMPEVVALHVGNKSFLEASGIIENIIIGYEDDFRKYAGRVPTERLRETMRSSALQAGKKFVYKHAYLDAKSDAVHNALNLLTMAGVVSKVFHSASNGVPLGAEIDLRKFKTLPVDIAIYQRLAGLRIQELTVIDPGELIHKGALAEAFVGQELRAYHVPTSQPDSYYWHRESKSSNAEVDYVVEVDTTIVPVEVKASSKGSMTSMRLFLTEKRSDLGIRVSTENFNTYQNIITVPIYAVAEIPRIVRAGL